ncbi:MAG TPA: PadR family transcriptional regulator [Candidatus Pelethocola excrementipullorum]|nr:PadR family transcriptional regulator [Candidatus Pelethocola excrementipullorum]
MRTLKYAILGLINRKPMTGYDIMKEFRSALGNFWSAKHSQIYPELKKLTKEGLLEYKTVMAGETLQKKLYTITEAGHTDFMQWLQRSEEIEPTAKDIFRLRMYFAAQMDGGTVNNLLEDQLSQRSVKLEHLKDTMQSLNHDTCMQGEALGDYLVLDGAIMREESYITWLKKCIDLISNYKK